jgi:glycosyltransferase involved in cell wall biosynthesis
LKAAPELASKLLVIPHGVDSDVFYKLEGTRAEFRRNLFGPDNNLEDKFIILSASRNQPRKRLDITMRGFKIFAKDKPDVRLYMHCGVVDASIHVAKEAVRLGIDEKLIISNLNYGPQQVPLERLNMIYNACDVGINTSMGEGWGLPIVEHAVTGAPQIVPNHSACAELYGDCGLLVPTVTHYTFDTIMTVGMLVSPEDVAIQMENIYQNKDLYAKLSTAGVEKFTRPEYQWNHISSRWLGVFREACSK